MATKKNWAQKLKEYIDKEPLTILIVLSVFFISSFFTISQGIKRVFDYYDLTINWKQVEYNKINAIQAGMSLDRFNETFGVPLYSRVSKGGYRELVYKRNDYWIQAIASSSGEVAFYSVTSCDMGFNPPIRANPIHADITLGESTFSSVSKTSGELPDWARYYFRVATANSQFYDSYYLGNPSAYKTVFVGINDACSMPEADCIGNKDEYSTRDFDNPEVIKFREMAVINSYGESSPFHDAYSALEGFQFGVDRIQVRTLK